MKRFIKISSLLSVGYVAGLVTIPTFLYVYVDKHARDNPDAESSTSWFELKNKMKRDFQEFKGVMRDDWKTSLSPEERDQFNRLTDQEFNK